jgi:hypothetical protein
MASCSTQFNWGGESHFTEWHPERVPGAEDLSVRT